MISSRGFRRWGTGSVPSDKRREDEQSKVERNPNTLDFGALFVLLFSTAVEINVWEIAVFECAFMKRVKLGARDSVLHGNRSLFGSGVAKL